MNPRRALLTHTATFAIGYVAGWYLAQRVEREVRKHVRSQVANELRRWLAR